MACEIKLYNAWGMPIASAPVKSKARRYSMYCAAAQKQLNELSMANPAAASATIGEMPFRIPRPGVSLCTIFEESR